MAQLAGLVEEIVKIAFIASGLVTTGGASFHRIITLVALLVGLVEVIANDAGSTGGSIIAGETQGHVCSVAAETAGG